MKLVSSAGRFPRVGLALPVTDDVAFFAHTMELGSDELGRWGARGVDVVPGEVQELVVEADRLTGVALDGAA